MEGKLGMDAALTEIVTFEYYLCCQNWKHISEKLKNMVYDLTIQLTSVGGYSIRDDVDKNGDRNGVDLKNWPKWCSEFYTS